MKLIKIKKSQKLYMILQGGLGNQLFIYFAAKFIENNYGKQIVFISNEYNEKRSQKVEVNLKKAETV